MLIRNITSKEKAPERAYIGGYNVGDQQANKM
jgi:hypothetical protein